MIQDSWQRVFNCCSEADVIFDDKISKFLLWRGGLTQLAGCGALSCQHLNSKITQYGSTGVIVISTAIYGEMVKQLELIIRNTNWKNIYVFTIISGSAHLNLHGVSNVAESEMFGQFSGRIREWNRSVQKVETFALCSLPRIDFGEEESPKIISNSLIPLMPSEIGRFSTPEMRATFGNLSFFNLPKVYQTNILTFTEAIRDLTSGFEMDIWSCGDISKLVGNQLIKSNGKSETNKLAVVIFDKIVDLSTQANSGTTALDEIFSHFNPLEPQKLNDIDLLINLQKPQTPHEARLFAALMKNDILYCRKLSDIILNDILTEEEIDFSSSSSFSEKLKIIRKNEDSFIYNSGFISTSLLLSHAVERGTSITIEPGLSNEEIVKYVSKILQTEPDNLEPKVVMKFIFEALSKLEYGRNDDDGSDLIMSCLCVFLEGLNPNKRHDFFPYFNIPNGGSMGQIHEKINIFIGRLKSDIISCQKRFGQFGMVQIIENLFIGLPQPNFMEHHEAGLIGRLTSGFGFFGNQSAPKTPKDYSKIMVISIGGVTFSDAVAFQRLGEKYGKSIEIVSNKIFTNHSVPS